MLNWFRQNCKQFSSAEVENRCPVRKQAFSFSPSAATSDKTAGRIGENRNTLQGIYRKEIRSIVTLKGFSCGSHCCNSDNDLRSGGGTPFSKLAQLIYALLSSNLMLTISPSLIKGLSTGSRAFRQDERSSSGGFTEKIAQTYQLMTVGSHERQIIRMDIEIDTIHYRAKLIIRLCGEQGTTDAV